MIYLDYAATTPIDREVLDEMIPWLEYGFGNPGSRYAAGRQARFAVDRARKQVADLINAEPEKIIFTSGGSEANNLAILGVQNHLQEFHREGILISPTEHSSAIRSADELYCRLKMCGDASIDYLKLGSDGAVDVESLKNDRFERKGLLIAMKSNNETGISNDVKTISEFAKEAGMLYHMDAVQALGTYPIDVKDIGCTSMSMSSHKINGPKGVGALYAAHPKFLKPVIYGGKAQELGLRAGTENVVGIVGFGKACEIAKRDMEKNRKKTSAACEAFMASLMHEVFKYDIQSLYHVNAWNRGDDVQKTVSIRFDGIDAETLVMLLDTKGVCVSEGAACEGSSVEASHVLTAMGLTKDQARNSIRVSFSKYTTETDAVFAAQIMAQCIGSLTKLGAENV